MSDYDRQDYHFDLLCVTGNLESTIEPYTSLFTYKVLPLIFMYYLSVPVEISFQRSWSSVDCIFRSSRDISGLIAIPGKSLSFARLERIEDTSQDRENFARIGRCLVSVYFPSLWQSRSEWSGTCGSTDFTISVMALVS